MTALVTVSGTFFVEVIPENSFDKAAQKTLAMRLEHFVDAIEYGMFMPAQLLNREPTDSPGCAVGFRAKNVPQHAFQVLSGMLEALQTAVGPLAFRRAWKDDDLEIDLLIVNAQPPDLPRPLPKHVEIELKSQRVASPLEVEVEFERPVQGDAERSLIIRQLETWNALMQGGYSATGAHGEGATTLPTIRFRLPTTVRFHCAEWFSNPRCLVPFLLLVGGWHQTHVVRDVSVTAL